MKNLTPEKLIIYGVLAGVGLLALKIASSGVKGTAQAAGAAVVDLVGGTVSGAYEALPDAVKPSSRNNVIYRGINGIGGVISGDDDFSLGGWIYDVTH